MVVYTEDSFVNSRKQLIFTVSYVPSTVNGLLFFQHGFGEYVGRYNTFFEELSSKANIAVYSFDMHGHGKSEPKEEKGRAFVEHFDDLIDDASQCLDIIKQSQPTGVPLLIGGQSLGGLVALHLLLKRQKDFAGLILHSAALDVEWTPVLR